MAFLTIRRTRLDYDDIPAKREAAPQLVLLHEGLGSVALWRDFPSLLAAATGTRPPAAAAPIESHSRRLSSVRASFLASISRSLTAPAAHKYGSAILIFEARDQRTSSDRWRRLP